MTLLKSVPAFLAVLAALACAPASAEYPDKPVRVIVTTVPGPLDAFARAVLTQMQLRLKQPFVVENKPGAGGNLGTDVVAKAPADGYTVLFALDTTFTVNPSIYTKLPFDPAKDFSIISVPVTYSQMLAVNPKVPVNNLNEFVQFARKSKISYASGGNGSPSHLTMAAFLSTAGLDMVHVPYKGTGASVVDVMGGQVESLFAVTSGISPQVKAGKLRALAVSGEQRSAAAPDVPTVAEQGYPAFRATFAYVLAVPVATPLAIQRTLARELEAAMRTREVLELCRTADYAVTGMSPLASTAWVGLTRTRWADVIRKSKITAD
jgi:tripartite-type tricarboxylate transporter receptor subunit TctC